MSTAATGVAGTGEVAHIGKSVSIRGDISGNEDFYVDGNVEGSIQLNGHSLTVGPNGKVHANIVARNVTVGGSIKGNIHVTERTEMRKTAVVTGDVQTRRIAIEEGAYFKGKLEILTSSGSAGASTSANPPQSAPHASEPGK
ncbi:MAG: polymer-forming cytoskeletal protein [Acidobacteria bacterium]|nr:polymer-forming cytoskeletal protein [Acidobacteriota bacterium]